MKRISFLFFLVMFSFLQSWAQQFPISGKLTDKTGQALIGAGVAILHPGDSSLVKATTTDIDGNYKLEAPPGKILIRLSYLGYEDMFTSRELADPGLLLGSFVLKEKSVKLGEVNIVSNKIPVQQKSDTTQIDAGAYKTNPDATSEDLVNKMPGITTQDGKVQAHGEDVQKVLVDGKEFFGDDANAVLKNLPAEVVDKIQIFDKRSEQSELSGFDDGNTTKTINVVTKTQFRNGVFGKVYGGYGYQDKWKGGGNINYFKDKRRITFLLNSNNVNEQNFSSEDLLGVMSSSSNNGNGGGGYGKRGGGKQGGPPSDAGNFLVDPKNGISTTYASGINYSNQWKKAELTGSYFINYTDNSATSDLFRQYISNEGTGLVYNEQKENKSKNVNHRMNVKFTWKPDSLNTLVLQPKFSMQQNDLASTLLGENINSGRSISATGNNYSSSLRGMNGSLPVNYRHSFSKRGRSISLNLTPGYKQDKGDSHLLSYADFYTDTLSADSLNQLATRDVEGLSFYSNLNYTEPITEKSQLMFSYGNNLNNNESARSTYNFSAVDNGYTRFDTTLSNTFSSRYVSQSFGTSYHYLQKKWNLTTGLSYQLAQLKGEQIFPYPYAINKTFNSLLPNAQLQYRFSQKKNLKINYRSSNNAPSVSQLQDVINNSNALQLSTGNPNLEQDWQNNLSLRYTSANTIKSRSFFGVLSGTLTKNYIVNSTIIANKDTLVAPGIILASGSQLSKPVNLDGYFSLRSFVNYSFPLVKLKSNLNLNLGGSYSQTPGLVNYVVNYSNNYNVGAGFALSSNISEKIDFTLSSNTTYNSISNSLQASLNSVYINQNSKLRIQVMPWKGLVIQTDLNHQYNTGLSATYNQVYLLWNGALGYKFGKKRLAELRLSVFDILKQNSSIVRNTTETYYEDVRTNVLQQYFMLTFTYNIKYFKETKKAQE
jgi:hypothetical protein